MGWIGWAVASAQEPMWQACRPKALPIEGEALFQRPLPPLRAAVGAATADQAVAGHRLVVDPSGWVLDGAPVSELPKLDAVVVAVAADLPGPEVLRLLEALKGSGAAVWMAYAAPGRPPAGSRAPEDLPPVPRGGEPPAPGAPPGTVAAWNKVLGACGPGKVLVAPAADCAGVEAAWKAVTDNPRCVLPPRLVRDVRGPVGAGTPGGVAVEPFVLEPAHDAWLRPDQTWADLDPNARWVKLGEQPWGEGPPQVFASDLSLRNRTTPAWPDGVPKKRDTAARCVATVAIDRDGRPSGVSVAGCDAPFAAEVEKALTGWFWAPPRVGGFERPVTTDVAFRFVGGQPGTTAEE